MSDDKPTLSRDLLQAVPEWGVQLLNDLDTLREDQFSLHERLAALEEKFAYRVEWGDAAWDKFDARISALERYLEEFDAEQRGLGP